MELPGATVARAAITALPSAKSLHTAATRSRDSNLTAPSNPLAAIADVGGVHCRSPWYDSSSRASCSGGILWRHVSLAGLDARFCSRLLVRWTGTSNEVRTMDVRDKLRAASQRLLQGFKDSRGTRDRRGKGTQREGFISSELAKILPSRYAFGTGEVIRVISDAKPKGTVRNTGPYIPHASPSSGTILSSGCGTRTMLNRLVQQFVNLGGLHG